MNAIPLVVSRWVHLWCAGLLLGGFFFLRFILPAGLRQLEAQAGHASFLRARRVLKMVVHTCILLLILSGAYNAVRYWPAYSAVQPIGLGHGVFGIHLLLALCVFGVSLWLLAGKEPPAGFRMWGAINVLLLFLTVAAASVVKYVRETGAHPGPARTVTAAVDQPGAVAAPAPAAAAAATQP